MTKKVRSTIKSNRTKDILTFLFFVFVSAIFWFVQELDETFSMEVKIPVRLTGVPEGIIITTDVPRELTLTIHDKGSELLPLWLHSKVDTLRINFQSYDTQEPTGHGTLMYSQLQNSIKRLLPAGAVVSNMSPDTVSFYYNRGLHRRFPVRLRGSIEAAQQYCILGYSFSPDSVDVYAPRTMLDTMTAAYTDVLNMRNVEKGFTENLALRSTRGMRLFPDSVTIKADVDVMTRQSVEVPVVGLNFPAGKSLCTFPATVKVSYLVPSKRKKTIDESQFAVVITYAELQENSTNKCRPHLSNAPFGITGTLVDPIEVTYLIEESNEE